MGGVGVARDLGLPVEAEVLLLAEVRVLVPAPLLAHAPDVVEHEPGDVGVSAPPLLLVVYGRHLQQFHEVLEHLVMGDPEAPARLVREEGESHFWRGVGRETRVRTDPVVSPAPQAADPLYRHDAVVEQIEFGGDPVE